MFQIRCRKVIIHFSKSDRGLLLAVSPGAAAFAGRVASVAEAFLVGTDTSMNKMM